MQTQIEHYELLKQEAITDIHSVGYLWRHKKTGARILILENEDENKVFHITFRTPPANSTGVAHIMEHSVLCGSEKYPLKDPFVELVKGSLNTFLNAMTYSEKTMYPVASCNDSDFSNLISVYMDAVFYPNIYRKEEIFRQEGWSYQLENREDEISYNGVVYNEMKGAFSSAEDVLDREIFNSLFPDTTYGNESGGDPECIPDLTYEAFLDFHRNYYHPSNCYVYLYGDCNMEEKLKWLDEEYFSRFDAKTVASKIPMQPPFSKLKEVHRKYSVTEAEGEEKNTYLSWNLVVGTSLDTKLSNAFAVLEYVLLTAPGAPLKQALLDAGIGKDVFSSYDSGTLQPVFSVVTKMADANDLEAFTAIIRQVLKKQIESGLDKKALLAGINNMEFKFREADYGSYPKGLMYGIDVMDSWLYDDDAAFDYLKQIPIFDELKKETQTDYFERLIQTYLLDNAHGTLLVLEPQIGLTRKKEEETRKKLSRIKASMSEAEIEKLIADTKQLRVFQETPSTPEELEKIPVITREQIKKEAALLYNEEHTIEGIPVLHHNLVTNGIGYLSLLFDTSMVPERYTPYLGILKTILGMVDTKHYTYNEICHEINLQSGGINTSLSMFADVHQYGSFQTYFLLSAKVLYNKIGFAFDMAEEILLTSHYQDEKRLKEVLSELKSRLEVRLTSGGHSTAAVRAMAAFSPASSYNDQTSGIAYYKVVEELEEQFDEKKEEIIRILGELISMIFTRENLKVGYVADEEGFAGLCDILPEFVAKLPQGTKTEAVKRSASVQKTEGFLTPAQIQYVAQAGNFAQAGLPYHGALRILKVIMSYEYLWVNVRVKGGAYGCMSGFGRTGDSYFVSYRDPHVRQTLNVYEGVTDYVKQFTASTRDMLKYIIGTISELDTPMNPSAKGGRSLSAYLCGITYEDLQKERDQILSADEETIRSLAPYMEAILKEGAVCVIGNEEKLKKEKDLFETLEPFTGAE